MKTLVTHMGPDLDAISSVWLIKKYLPGWEEADLTFVPAGSTLDDLPPDENPDIIHVDTGKGMFDHHHLPKRLSAARQVYNYLLKKKLIYEKDKEALERMVEYFTIIDNFEEVYFHDPTSDIYEFGLHQVIYGLKSVVHTDVNVVNTTIPLLEGVLSNMKNKIAAEREMATGITMKTKWGKSLMLESKNEDTIQLAQKSGYSFVARKDPAKGNIRIKTIPDKKLDLTPLYEAIIKVDKKGTWYLHISKNMLLNGSSKNPNSVPSPLTLPQLIEIIKKV